jgi:Mn-containing catalase
VPTSSGKPTYLGLLNAIAVAEARAHRYLGEWIAVCPDPEVRAVLQTVAWREGEHAMSFARRIDELGYSLRQGDDPDLERDLAVARSTEMSDLAKFEHFGLGRLEDSLSFFDDVFKDHTIDIRTGELLGRYVAEEFDSARRLAACYRQLQARQDEVAASR